MLFHDSYKGLCSGAPPQKKKQKKKKTRKIKKKNTYSQIIRHFKYYHVILFKHGKLFHSDMHIIKSEWHNTKLAFR